MLVVLYALCLMLCLLKNSIRSVKSQDLISVYLKLSKFGLSWESFVQLINFVPYFQLSNIKAQLFGGKISPNFTQTLGYSYSSILKFVILWMGRFSCRNYPSHVGVANSKNVYANASHSQNYLVRSKCWLATIMFPPFIGVFKPMNESQEVR